MNRLYTELMAALYSTSQITFSQWASIMATLGFVLSEEQRAMICHAFAVPGFKDYVNYREFLKRVDS